jgi:glycosyltransferase involved in cell wall biosynthesis
MTDLVSIIIPCFNNEEFIEEAIDSALKQSHPAVEVIVVDDGSTDSSWQRIQKYQNRIIARRQVNAGACVARNTGLSIASGKWIKFLDADDVLKPDCIELQIARCHDERIVIYGDCEFIDAKGNPILNSLNDTATRLNDGDFAILSSFFSAPVLTSTTLFPRSVLTEFNGFNPAVHRGQEHELNLRLYSNGIDFQYFPQVCYQYRQHNSPSRISIGKRKEHFFNMFENFKWLVSLAEHGPRSASFNSERAMLGRIAWKTGRHWLRQGEANVAKRFFAEATRIAGSKSIYGSGLYRRFVGVFGPNIAERISTLSFALRQGPKDGA